MWLWTRGCTARGLSSAEGSYCGLDANAECIEWCATNILGEHGNFRFDHLDVHSEAYNPTGSLQADQVTLPYPGSAFDRGLLSSLFTHMAESGVVRYLAELGRVIVPNGRVLVSALLMNPETKRAVDRGTTLFEFTHSLGPTSWTLDPSRPLEAVALSEPWLKQQAEVAGFELGQVFYGTWREGRRWEIHHDWLVLKRTIFPPRSRSRNVTQVHGPFPDMSASPPEAMYGLIGRIETAPGAAAELASILTEGVAGMPGCLSYVVAHDAEDPDALWVTEVWDSRASHEASLSLPSVQAAIARGRPLIKGFSDRFVTHPVGGLGLA